MSDVHKRSIEERETKIEGYEWTIEHLRQQVEAAVKKNNTHRQLQATHNDLQKALTRKEQEYQAVKEKYLILLAESDKDREQFNMKVLYCTCTCTQTKTIQ